MGNSGSGGGGKGGGAGRGGRNRSVGASPPPSSAITQEERSAMNVITGSGYKSINKALSLGEPLSEFQLKTVRDTTSMLNKLPDAPGTTYRALSWGSKEDAAKFFAQHQVGQVVQYNAFVHTSRRKIFGFGSTHSNHANLYIKGKHGKDVKPYSMLPHEDETMFRPKSRFRVTKVSGNNIYLEEVD